MNYVALKEMGARLCDGSIHLPSKEETTLKEIQELIDASYEDGRRGADGRYPLDAADMLSDYEKKYGRQVDDIVPITRKIVAAMNAAYERGRNEAGQ